MASNRGGLHDEGTVLSMDKHSDIRATELFAAKIIGGAIGFAINTVWMVFVVWCCLNYWGLK